MPFVGFIFRPTLKSDWLGMALALHRGCPQLNNSGSANHHPQKDIYRVKRGVDACCAICIEWLNG